MSKFAGGCLCRAVRYEATGAPLNMGLCYCGDCRKASGSGFIPFIGFRAEAVRFTGETLQFRSPAFRGGEAVRNSCPKCGGLVFGGVVGVDTEHTIYAGTLDEPSLFKPTIAIFTRDKPDWVAMPEGLKTFETMPGIS
ncbi:MAG: GFA family protein [Proteobacteria bacterium]|nr:GFA family protein [Pseudomonadota bacterium]